MLDDAGSLVSSSTTWTGGTRYDTSEEADADADDHGHLTFRSGTVALTPEPAQDVRPGDGWEGLLAGTRYRLKAGCDDVEYETSTGATVRLSQDIGSQQARDVARRLGGVKKGGGRLYVNEAGVVIGPVRRDLTWIDVYVGRVGPTPGSGRP